MRSWWDTPTNRGLSLALLLVLRLLVGIEVVMMVVEERLRPWQCVCSSLILRVATTATGGHKTDKLRRR
jgi:hypothetical protein